MRKRMRACGQAGGIDYLKYDNCYNEGEEGIPKLSFGRYNAMARALNDTGRPILYAKTLSILQNPAVLAVSQDPLGSVAIRRWRYFVDDTDEFGKGEIQLYTGPLSGGDQLVVLLNAGTKPREMNATLVGIFWNNGPAGTAVEIQQSWDVYDLRANRMSDDEAWVIINATSSSPSGLTNRTGRHDLSAMGGFEKVYSETPSSSSKVLLGSKVGTVRPSGTVKAHVRPHGVAMLRLCGKNQKDEL